MSILVLETKLAAAHRLAPWLVAWAVLASVQIITPLWYPTPDACCYLSIARSLAQTGHATNLGNPHLMFAPGYPFFLSLVYRLHAAPFLALTIVHVLLTGVYLAGTYVWVRRYAPEAALGIALIAVGNVIVLGLLRRALSEAVFLPLMIWLVNALAAIRPREKGNLAPLMAAAVLAAALIVVRQAGVLFVAGFGLQIAILACRRSIPWRRACFYTLAVALPALLTLVTVIVADQKAAGGVVSSNLDFFVHRTAIPQMDYSKLSAPAQVLEGMRVRISEVGRLLIPGMFNSYAKSGVWLNVNMLLYVALIGLLIFGWFRLLRRHLDAFALTLPLYIGLYVYWPFNQSGRYFAPLIPLLVLCAWYALEALGRKRVVGLGILAAAHLAVALGYWLAIDRPRALAAQRCWPDVHKAAEVIKSSTGRIEAQAELEPVALMLQYELDVHVPETPRGQASGPNAQWLVVASDQTLMPGFTERARFNSFRLMQRATAQASSSTPSSRPVTASLQAAAGSPIPHRCTDRPSSGDSE